MCLYPKLILNKKYYPTPSNNYNPPEVKDYRTTKIPAACGKCLECRKKKRRDWQVRLDYENRHNPMPGFFVTFTFAPEHWRRMVERNEKENGSEQPYYLWVNSVAGIGVRWWRERLRQDNIEFKYWLCPELGHKNGRMHLHGFVWLNDLNGLEHWDYGWKKIKPIIDKSVAYATKYMFKINPKHKEYIPRIFCSKGIGEGYVWSYDARRHYFAEDKTNELYRTASGRMLPLPIYWRNKLFNEDEREKLWVHKLNEQKRYVLGEEIDISSEEGLRIYADAAAYGRKISERMGFIVNGDYDRELKNYKASLKYLNSDV